MKTISKTFLTGMATVLPVFLTLYVLYWFATSAEHLLGTLLKLVLPDSLYWPGMGLTAALLLILAVGVLMHAWVVRALVGWAERLLYRIPLIKSVYGSLRDFFTLFAKSGADRVHQPVMVRIGDTDFEVMGFVMREDFSDLPAGLAAPGAVAVYLPMSYQIGGYTAILPRDRLRAVDMPMEQAMRFALTAGLTTSPVSPSSQTSSQTSPRN